MADREITPSLKEVTDEEVRAALGSSVHIFEGLADKTQDLPDATEEAHTTLTLEELADTYKIPESAIRMEDSPRDVEALLKEANDIAHSGYSE